MDDPIPRTWVRRSSFTRIARSSSSASIARAAFSYARTLKGFSPLISRMTAICSRTLATSRLSTVLPLQADGDADQRTDDWEAVLLRVGFHGREDGVTAGLNLTKITTDIGVRNGKRAGHQKRSLLRGWRGWTGRRRGRSAHLFARPAPRKARVHGEPVLDARLAAAPAEADDPILSHRAEVDEAQLELPDD